MPADAASPTHTTMSNDSAALNDPAAEVFDDSADPDLVLGRLLDDLRSVAYDERDKGARFERLVADAMRTSPVLGRDFTNVWMWADWPAADGRPDTGIDIVAEDVHGGLVAVQCKFYPSAHKLTKADVDSFFTASGKEGFTRRVIATTADDMSPQLEDAMRDQQIPVTTWQAADLARCGIDWAAYSQSLKRGSEPSAQVLAKKQLRPHQRAAIDDVVAGWRSHDRGKLVMACGTGKTFTSLKLVEEVAGPGGLVLFMVPSIALMQQTLSEWLLEAELRLAPFTVCSDGKIGKRTVSEDAAAFELLEPATTDAAKLFSRVVTYPFDDALRVVFCTYQSLQVVADAQQRGLGVFDAIVCDEAHRTTGVTLVDGDESAFVKIHDNSLIKGKKRVYMTATPKVFGDEAKTKAADAEAVLCSMDDERTYGPEFHRLGFGAAVDAGLLTDYKVLVLNVDEGHVAATFQQLLADENNELNLDDAAKIVGCWNALAKKSASALGGEAFPPDDPPMRRAVAFCRTIKESERLAAQFSSVIDVYTAGDDDPLRCEVDHVDGKMNTLKRTERLDWLKAEPGPNECRILSNARCLSEGVDVPALDAVLFLTPRNSQVDVVQAVGRVMRKAPNKEMGYIILPVATPAGVEPHRALADNKRYKVVWQVLQALRSHDERFEAMVNQIELNKRISNRMSLGYVPEPDADDPFSTTSSQLAMMFPPSEWRDAILARIVQKVGNKTYWDQWTDDVRQIAERHVTRIQVALDDPAKRAAFDRFVADLREQLNPGITDDDAIQMLAQHAITAPVFDALFSGYEFSAHNPVSLTMQAMTAQLEDQSLDKDAASLEAFYASVRRRAEGIDNHEGRQAVITELYEKFFKKALPKVADSLGIVYTPLPVVDWMIRAVNQVLIEHFNTDLSSEGVHVIDPFTGTGTFIVRMLQSGLIRPEDLARKYASELHANEILLLAYYIAAINIEATYHGLAVEAGADKDTYEPFPGIVLTDTFQLAESHGSMDAAYFPDNRERVREQMAQDIRVIIGNPPYSAGQTSENDANKNQTYPALDARITESYVAGSVAGLSKSMHDSYIRAFRWASDRLRTEGVICFVSNGGWIDSNSADGFRRSLATEFDHIYVYNLRGNQRTSGEDSRREGGKVFGSGSRSTVAITLLIRTGAGAGCSIAYRDIGDYCSRDQKLSLLANSGLHSVDWEEIVPNESADWVNQRRDDFDEFQSLGDKRLAGDRAGAPIVSLYSLGIATNRDSWCWNFSKASIAQNTSRMIDTYNEQLSRRPADKRPVDEWVTLDPRSISWSAGLKAQVARGQALEHFPAHIVPGCYRPFCRQFLYFDGALNERVSRQLDIYPYGDHPNWGISLTGPSSHFEFTPLATSGVPDLHVLDSGQFFPRYRYETPEDNARSLFDTDDVGPVRIDNVTAGTLAAYRAQYGEQVSSDDIFHYVYGILHSPEYRSEFAADLTKQLPRIPKVVDFEAFAAAGKALAEVHLGYESAEPYPLGDPSLGWDAASLGEGLRVEKMRFAQKGDKSSIVFNSRLTLTGIPEEAYRYMLGSRSAIEWIIDRYQVRTHKDSGIVNDPNDWCDEVGDPRYIVDLVKRIVTVSLDTMKIVDALPPLDIIS